MLAVINFGVIVHGSAANLQCADSALYLLCRGVLVPLLTRLQTRIHDQGFHHLIYGSSSGYGLAYVASQGSTEGIWTPCDTDERYFYYKLDLGPVHDIPAEIVGACDQDIHGSTITGRTLQSSQGWWLVLAGCHPTLHEVRELVKIEGDQRD